ncbi:RagB/SusD family nutrient uptake outer membrane protein [Chryseobacterium balustinum]|uniref:RagB/SusD domain-containing protein n=1 Tax=Chryseobacterium balustinum TaxID=246 RepID=A0AAX2IMG5_9FLAO|nr:RagB/SusD family nutrient uptake outer membrane protein [Chryseobacterium balustinum]AZB29384.1 RagB/SusD family nutrient uptake outer membrane protein [Chryseobacterium balustinum]SKC02321.1 RagB/SusD domain-containing protein [Chryseobacterium balustinum]SQA90673.1 SusD family [Chryseobacterium balustinum]
MKNKFLISILSVSALALVGCTDLEELVIDESLEAQTITPIESFVAPAYGPLPDAFTHVKNYGLQLISSDQAILPPRGSGNDWYDGGKYIELHQHTTTTTNVVVQQTWDAMRLMLSRTVTALEKLRPLAATDPNAAKAVAEMRALRAYYNMLMLDYWGIAFKKDNTGVNSEILRRQEAISYIESEFLAVVNDLDNTKGPGRMSQAAVNGFLAQLYLNAAVYRNPYGAPNFAIGDMDKVIQYTDKVINSGLFNLSSEYFAIFDDNNHSNKELIFAIDQRQDLATSHNRLGYWSLSGSQYPLAAFPKANGTDGPAITPDFYQTWVQAYGSTDPAQADARFYKENFTVPADKQNLTGVTPANDADHYFLVNGATYEINRGIQRGIQWGLRNASNGQPFKMENGQYKIYPIIEQRNGFVNYVNHTLEIDLENPNNKDYTDGYRVSKYQFSRTSDSGRNRGNADIVLLRLADIYLMRAEAQLRKGNAGAALLDVNLVRASRTARPSVTPPALASINLDTLYRERGFEFYWEYSRRTDMIRFGHYEDPYTSKTNADVRKRLFPIPQSAIDGASAEPGYLVQNEGY